MQDGGANYFGAVVQREFDAVWPAHASSSTRPVRTGDRRQAPPIQVIAADAGALPRCARQRPVLFVHLAGLFRSLGDIVERLLAFLDGSANCWFVVLYTLSVAEQRAPWWCAVDHRGRHDDRMRCLARAAVGPSRFVGQKKVLSTCQPQPLLPGASEKNPSRSTRSGLP